MYYSFVFKNDIIMKKVINFSARMLRLTIKFISFKMRVRIILSSDGLTIDISERNRKSSHNGKIS